MGIEGRENSRKSVGELFCELEGMFVGVARAFFDRRWVPADQECLNIVFGINRGEAFRCLWNISQVSFEVAAGMMVETAGAGVNVDVEGFHGSSLIPWSLGKKFS